MKIAELIEFIESWAPPGSALEKDNPGLQVGDAGATLKNILLTLDVTEAVLDEAIEKGANLILSHHPLIFEPLRKVDIEARTGKLIGKALQHGITIYCAHTNLDASLDGVSMELARVLGIQQPRFLIEPYGRWMKKLTVFVPPEHVDAVRSAMAAAGAGRIGEYSQCSFNLTGTGTFLGSEAANPVVGKKGRLESVSEVRLEMILPQWRLDAVIRAMKAAHPYEEVAYDVYPLENRDVNYGFGAIGELDEPMTAAQLARRICERLEVEAVGFVQGPNEPIRRLAVCGGSGGELAEAACKNGAQAFVTGELKYHTMLEYGDRLSLIVAGHYATERIILPRWVERLRAWLGSESVRVMETGRLTDPLKYIS